MADRELCVVLESDHTHLFMIAKSIYLCLLLSGLTNTVTAVKNAQMAESPVLLMGGAAATLLKVYKCIYNVPISYNLVLHIIIFDMQ